MKHSVAQFNKHNFFVSIQDEYNRLIRRTVMRYTNLSTLLVFRLVSAKVRQRFPCYASLVESGKGSSKNDIAQFLGIFDTLLTFLNINVT